MTSSPNLMHREPKRFPRQLVSVSPTSRSLILAALVVLGTIVGAVPPVRAQAVDAGINQSVWKLLFGVSDAQANDPRWLAADDDGDGLNNGAELAAGTNPFKAGSNLTVTSTTADGTNVALTFPTVAGKLYVLQSTTNLTATNGGWTALNPGVQTVGDGTPRTLSAPQTAGPPARFFRVLVQDLDTDGDGVSDWAERVVGYDPNNPRSHGAAQDDRTSLIAALAAENVVTITATEAAATQPPDAVTAATDTGTFTVSRGGTLNFTPLTVPLNWSGTALPNVDYATLPGSVTFPLKVNTITLTAIPLANPAQLTGTTITGVVPPGAAYRLGAATSASVALAPAGNAKGTGLTASYYQETANPSPYAATLFDVSRLKVTRVDPTVDFALSTVAPVWPPAEVAASTNFVVRWDGQVQPQYSETYYFDTKTDDGVKLWVNGQLLIDGWVGGSTERVNSVSLRAGVRYDLRMEYYQSTGGAQARLYWYSDSQTKQIIPANRLYPKAGTQAPPAITSAPQAVGFVNQPFSFTVTASATGGTAPTFALGANSGPLPPGLTLNAATGVIAGTPTLAGAFPVALNATNTLGTGAAVLDLQILNVGSGVTRERWSNVPGSRVADIPVSTTPASIDNSLVTLEDPTVYPNNTGERLRGYFTAPTTGNYYFWLAANNAAEFWLADDAEPVNKIRRVALAVPGATARTWNDANRSPWLSLVAGQRYYYEVLHHTGTDGSPNLAVGWFLDPTGTTANPIANNTGVVPGYVLNRYDYPAAVVSPGTLYSTNLSPQGAATSSGTGSADLRMNPGNTQAVLHFSYSGLTSPRTAYHVHVAPDATGSGPIVFDIDDADKFQPDQRTPDGGYLWTIQDAGALTAAQIVTALREGRAYLNVHTVNYPNGEIRGNFGRVLGSQNPPAPVADPGFTDDSGGDAGAARFLNQAAYGVHPDDLAAVRANGYAAWLNAQFALPATHLLPDVNAHTSLDPMNPRDSYLAVNAWWRAAVTAPDQLRQRVAFALSEILVVSDSNTNLSDHGEGLASYYDTLLDNSFGNFRDLLRGVTLHPAMGYFLNMQGNPKGDLPSGLHPNENYGREILQLFSIGLNRLWPDGSLVLDSQGNLVPTYDQPAIGGFARVFTGWNWNQALQGNGRLPTNFSPPVNYTAPMTLVPTRHELGPKLLLNNVVLPAAVGYNPLGAPVSGSPADPANAAFDAYCAADLEKALDSVVNHPNVGPYLCRQLIQRLVASNPTPAYVQRVVQRWDDDGTAQHVRGNLQAVIRAILLDGEARNAALVAASTTAGKQREPLLRIAAPARTFPFQANAGTFSQSGAQAITVTTNSPHRLTGGDSVALDFTGNLPGAQATNPTTAAYSVLSTPAPTANAFAVNATGLTAVTYAQAAGSNVLTVNTGGPPVNTRVYLKFLAGGVADNLYPVTSLPDAAHFTVTTADTPTAARNGSLLLPRGTGSYTLNATGPTLTIVFYANHNLRVGDHFTLVIPDANSAQINTAEYTVNAVVDENRVTVTPPAPVPPATTLKSETGGTVTLYPLAAPPLSRNGNVALAASKFDMRNTNSTLAQTPLDAPTVFNFFSPDFQLPGTLAANNVTTPEFQLTTDTNIVNLTNTINSTILSSGNTRGLSSFSNGAILLDLGAYMTAPYASFSTVNTTTGNTVKATTTTTVDATALVNKLGDLLAGGMLTQATKDTIVAFLNNTTNFPTTATANGTVSPPVDPVVVIPSTCARDKARAAVQLILSSPEYAVQR